MAGQALNPYFDFCNRRRRQSTLDGNTLDTAYFSLDRPPLAAAASHPAEPSPEEYEFLSNCAGTLVAKTPMCTAWQK
jgi:hypothetical protein